MSTHGRDSCIHTYIRTCLQRGIREISRSLAWGLIKRITGRRMAQRDTLIPWIERSAVVSRRFQVSNEIRQALEARIFEARPSTISMVHPERRDAIRRRRRSFLDARDLPSCQRGYDVVSRMSYRRQRQRRRMLCPVILERWVPACRHAVLTGVVRRSEILRLRGGISGWKWPETFITRDKTRMHSA